jgi:RNA polymerase sigma-70 factor, ECF subfamily
MDEHGWLATRFEADRPHLRAVAYRILGSLSEADDAVQEAWLRLSRSETASVDNLGGWLRTVVARVCLDMLRSRTSRREEPLGEYPPEANLGAEDKLDPEQEALLADSVGPALLVVLDTLRPAERLAFVLHDLFDVPFEEIAPIVGRSPAAARQLASRARRRVQGAEIPDADLARQRQIVDAFLAASREGNLVELIALLDPNVVFRADGTATQAGFPGEVRGARTIATRFSRGARDARPALVGGAVGLVWAPGGVPGGIFALTITRGKISAIELIGDPERIRELSPMFLDD